MNEAVVALSVCFALLLALLAALLISTRWAVWVKLGMVLAVVGAFYLNYLGLAHLLGWPSHARLPERFLLLASSVEEPDTASGEPGVIHLWATSLEDARPSDAPRAYEMPYSRELHYTLQQARKRQGEGISQVGRRFELPASERPSDRSRFAARRESFEIEDLPDPVLPEK